MKFRIIICKSLFTFLTLLLLSACASGNNSSGTIPSNNEAFATMDDFELKLFSDKTTYSSNELIIIWANFKYVGNLEEIRIGHAMDYLVFNIIQVDGTLKFRGVQPEPYKTTILKKGVDYRKGYVKSIGYSKNEPNAEIYKNFLEGKDVLLPPGTYKITAVATFDLPDLQKGNSKKEFKTIPVEIMIKVTK